jgi:hypothetical protein
MDEHTTSLLLRENGLEVLTRSVPPADGPVLSDIDNTENPLPSTVAELDLVDPEDDDDEGDDDGVGDDVARVTVDQRDRPGQWENTELVAAAFRAAGNPKFEDVRLRSAKTSYRPAPTHREIALRRAKRANGSATW